MLCPLCKTEMHIGRLRRYAVGDSSPDTQTVVMLAQELCCRNPGCENFKKTVHTSETELYRSEDDAKDALLEIKG